MQSIFIKLIRAYQYLISPFLQRSCRFIPSCSQYAIEVIQRHGVIRGSWLSFKRVLRCNPLHPGGYDPAP